MNGPTSLDPRARAHESDLLMSDMGNKVIAKALGSTIKVATSGSTKPTTDVRFGNEGNSEGPGALQSGGLWLGALRAHPPN